MPLGKEVNRLSLFGKKKKEPDSSAETVENVDSLTPKTDEEIAEEVEEIASKLQSEIDNMMSEHPDADWKTLVNEAAEEKRAWQSTRTICECCGQAVVYGDEIYCEDCKASMKKYPFKWWHFVMPILALLVIAFTIWVSYSQWTMYSGTAKAQAYVRNHQFNSALNEYDTLNDAIDEAGGVYGWKYLANQIHLYEEIGIQEYTTLNNFLDNHYNISTLKKFYNHDAKEATALINSYTDAYTHFVTASNSANGDLEACLEAFNKEIEGEDVNAAYANYYRYYACLVYGGSSEEQQKYVGAIAAEGKEYASLYLPLYTEIKLNEKDYDGALAYADQMLERNSEDTYAYTYKGVAYRMQGDTAAASTALDKGLKVDSNNSPLNYQMAIIALLNEQYPLAEAYAQTAYEQATTTNNYRSAASLYGLIAEMRARQYQKAGNSDNYSSEHAIYTSIVGEVEDNGLTLSEDVDAILDGTKTVEGIFLLGEGDFAW